jgi:hypothetical protein
LDVFWIILAAFFPGVWRKDGVGHDIPRLFPRVVRAYKKVKNRDLLLLSRLQSIDAHGVESPFEFDLRNQPGPFSAKVHMYKLLLSFSDFSTYHYEQIPKLRNCYFHLSAIQLFILLDREVGSSYSLFLFNIFLVWCILSLYF